MTVRTDGAYAPSVRGAADYTASKGVAGRVFAYDAGSRDVVRCPDDAVADTGILAVTSKGAVFMGSRKTIETPYAKLVNVTVYSDAIVFHLSNRVNAPMLTIPSGSDVVAAVVNAAAQRA